MLKIFRQQKNSKKAIIAAAFSPYHVGVNLLKIANLHFGKLHTPACTLLGYCMIECCVFAMNKISRLFRWSKIHRATGICYLILKVLQSYYFKFVFYILYDFCRSAYCLRSRQ